MTKFILVIILNSIPQSIQVFDNREQCNNVANLIRKTEKVDSYCVPSQIESIVRNVTKIG
jgi:hypothetical protein